MHLIQQGQIEYIAGRKESFQFILHYNLRTGANVMVHPNTMTLGKGIALIITLCL